MGFSSFGKKILIGLALAGVVGAGVCLFVFTGRSGPADPASGADEAPDPLLGDREAAPARTPGDPEIPEEPEDPAIHMEELLTEYARRQPYLCESGEIYHGYMTVEPGWEILRYTTDERIPPAALGFRVFDYDGDSLPELLIVNKDGEDMPVLEMYEVAGEEVALQDWISEFQLSNLYSIFRWEESEFACSLRKEAAGPALVIEQKSLSPLYADGVSVVFVRVGYDGEHFRILGSFEDAGSDFTGAEREMEERLRSAGCECPFEDIIDEHRPFYMSCSDFEPIVCIQTRLYLDEVMKYEYGYDHDKTTRNRDAMLSLDAVSDITITNDPGSLSREMPSLSEDE